MQGDSVREGWVKSISGHADWTVCPDMAYLLFNSCSKETLAAYSNMRDINGEIMRQITDALYEQIVE